MKKLLFLAAMLGVIQVSAQWPWEKIEGNGQIRKESRQVGSYTAVSSAGAWDVMIGYGESSTIQVEGDENLLPYIETEVENGKLQIRTKKRANLHSRKKITIYVSLTKMTGVSLSGSGDIIGKGRFRNEGSTSFKVSGSGNIRIDLDKVGDADVSISGSGNITLAGSANRIDARVSGSGNADCQELITNDAEAHISGSGNIKLNANKSVDASISGSGNVSYKGSAAEVKKHVAGSGRLVKI
ncbi:head GIN domain-containing protein [Sediminibacterium soli]|uniref:head GIN domain-containing protein n=1 Tax=Sediminibacterium soli TaxID=2698829 RepID=UPI00137A692F|nr:head GIN domain-containing protein [Sediminibacterium soli]NCI47939.1 DUF2807 domain-containing protein [Sediminibacterium soli]